MIVVDTSVWIDVLNGNSTPAAERCVALVDAGAPVALTDIILTEVLQGFRTEREAELVERRFVAFPIVPLVAPDDYLFAAALYRSARRSGISVRRTLDCLIAAACIRSDALLLHADRDFDLLASCTPLQILGLRD